jgi:hypothetical protein
MAKKNKSNRKSLKGEWGHIGAPPKKTRWPSRPFTMATLFARNDNQCQLSLRTKVTKGVKAGEIVELKAKKQPHGAVGRPSSVFVLKANYDSKTMTLADKPAKTPKARKAKVTAAPVAVVSPAAPVAAPAPAPAPETAAPVASADIPAPAPAPVESAPVSTAPAVAAPATPEPATAS